MHIAKLSALPYCRKNIRNEVYKIKQKLGLLQQTYIDIIKFIELVLPKIDPDFRLEVVSNSYFKDRYAEACPSEHLIRVPNFIYKKAYRGDKFCRIILAHELGHYLMHGNEKITFAYSVDKSYNIERQADIFSTEFLIPYDFARKHSIKEISMQCGVPYEEARKYKKYITKEYRYSKNATHKAKRKRKASNFKRKAGTTNQR